MFRVPNRANGRFSHANVPFNGAPAGGGPTPNPIWPFVVFQSDFTGEDGSTTIVDQAGIHGFTLSGGGANCCIKTDRFNSAPSSFRLNQVDGTGRSITITGSLDTITFETGDFTLECYLNLQDLSQALGGFFNDPSTSYGFFINGTTSRIDYASASGGIAGVAPTADTWTHAAYAREGGVGRLFIGGVLRGTLADSANYATPRSTLFRTYGSTREMWIDDVRICKGIALYTADFTPPAVPYPTEFLP